MAQISSTKSSTESEQSKLRDFTNGKSNDEAELFGFESDPSEIATSPENEKANEGGLFDNLLGGGRAERT